MKVLLMGGGARAQSLGDALRWQDVAAVNLNPDGPVAADWPTRVHRADAVILPIPTGLFVWGPEGPDCAQVLAAGRGDGAVIGAWPHGAPVGCVNLLQNKTFKRMNAIPTAEGAMAVVLGQSQRVFYDSTCLLVGFGEVAQALCRRLLAFGARVVVWTRRTVDLPPGVQVCPKGWPSEVLAQVDFLFNTVPSPVLGADALVHLPPHCLLCELASAPYGFHPLQAQALGLRTMALPGLPRRFSRSTAQLTAQCLLDMLTQRGDA